jgi:hypothetical protein
MRKVGGGFRRSALHAGQQHFRLPIEQCQHLTFEPLFAECHAQEMGEVNGVRGRDSGSARIARWVEETTIGRLCINPGSWVTHAPSC